MKNSVRSIAMNIAEQVGTKLNKKNIFNDFSYGFHMEIRE